VTTGAAVDVITLGNGTNTVITAAGAETITVGTGANTVTPGAGADTVVLGAGTNASSSIVMAAAAQTYAAATPGTIVTGVTQLTGIDKVSGLQIGDTISLAGVVNTLTGATVTTIAGATGDAVALVRGNFATATNIFTTSATGTDTLLVYDINGAVANDNVEAIALIGVVATGTVAAGVLTLTAV
jgi:S-layer protein